MTQVLFKPDIYVTVIAWTPFLCQGAQTVLHQVTSFSSSLLVTFLSLYCAAVQGWLLTPNNLDTFMRTVVSGLHKLEEHVSRVAAFVIDELGSGELLHCH